MFASVLECSMIKRAHQKGLVTSELVNFRKFATDRHHTVDDTPYGGGGGMLLKPEPLFVAVEHLLQGRSRTDIPIILLTPQGKNLTQRRAQQLATQQELIIICGHYEGFDERVRTHLATEELSLGDYVLTGGELAAMVLLDSVIRLVPGVLGNDSSAACDSFAGGGLLEYPQYTKPQSFRGLAVPDVLLSGDHQAIANWRREQALLRTKLRRPDLLQDK
ncbi:MAG: tRNA ((37)-N1)-methyltransferase TrmD [Bacillota bacterium]